MTVKFGFYDSLNGDRLYNANDFNTIFEGVFSDGVFEHVGDGLMVEPNPGVMGVLVKTGRAWFNNSWIRNTSILSVLLTPSSLIHDRIDLIVLEFDSGITVRENSIKVLTGIPAAIPIPPVLANTSTLHQYALAEVLIPATSYEVLLTNITNKIGSVGTPYSMSLISEPYSGPVTTLVNDFQVGDGFGNWITKTLAQTITILRTSLDSIYAAIAHNHSASDITSGTLSDSRLPLPTTTTLGGVARNTGATGEYVTGIDSSGNLEYDTPAGGGGGSSDGWASYSAVIPTRSASDSPTYTLQFAGVDLRTTLYEGMPVKWTQNSIIRYGWISSNPVFSTNTTITVLTRLDSSSVDYDVLDTTTYPISNFYYGLPMQPGLGFPTSVDAWTTLNSSTTNAGTGSPTAGVWYNPTGMSLSVPIGKWKLGFGVRVWTEKASSQVSTQAACSSSTSSATEPELSFSMVGYAVSVSSIHNQMSMIKSLLSKTTFYQIVKTDTAGCSSIYQKNSTGFECYIKAVSAYVL